MTVRKAVGPTGNLRSLLPSDTLQLWWADCMEGVDRRNLPPE